MLFLTDQRIFLLPILRVRAVHVFEGRDGSGQTVVLVKNENYWDTAPEIGKVTFYTVEDESEKLAGFKRENTILSIPRL
jgi:hypothetical protein